MKEIEYLISKSKRFLRTAEIVFNDGDYDSCVSRCYYAMFFMAQAALLTKNLKTHSHKGVMSLFGILFIKSGIFNTNLGKYFRKIYNLRQKGDYGIGFMIDKEDAEECLKMAEIFVKEVEKYLKRCIK